jgi:hypothetical protein
MSAKVLLDLNLPAFQDDLLGLDGNEVRLVLKTLRKLRGLEWDTVYRDGGLKKGSGVMGSGLPCNTTNLLLSRCAM